MEKKDDMLYHLFDYLKDFNIPGAGLMQYLSFRAIFASVTSLLIAVFIGKRIIRWLQKKQIGEEIRDLGLEGQMQKKGTPTMGGIIILLAILIAALLFCDLTNVYTILLIISTVWFGILGFADDFIKVFRHNKEGMSEKGKLIGQVVMGLVIGVTVCFNEHIVIREEIPAGKEPSGVVVSSGNARAEGDNSAKLEYPGAKQSPMQKGHDVVKSTKTTIPFVKNHEFDYKLLSPFYG